MCIGFGNFKNIDAPAVAFASPPSGFIVPVIVADVVLLTVPSAFKSNAFAPLLKEEDSNVDSLKIVSSFPFSSVKSFGNILKSLTS